MKRSEGDCSWGRIPCPTVLTGLWLGLVDANLLTCITTKGLRYHGFTGHSLEEGVEGVEDPGAEEAEDLGTHDVGQVGLKTQGLMNTK